MVSYLLLNIGSLVCHSRCTELLCFFRIANLLALSYNNIILITALTWGISSVSCINMVARTEGYFLVPLLLTWINVKTLRPRRNEQHFADDIFKRIFFNENVGISIKISLRFVPKGPINNIPALVQIMAWRRPGDKPLSEPMMVSLLTHICVARPQRVNLSTNV